MADQPKSKASWENNFVAYFSQTWNQKDSESNPGRRVADLISLIPIILTVSNDDLPAHVKELTVALAKHGWFLSRKISPSDLICWKALVQKADSEAIDKHFSRHYRDRIKAIQQKAMLLFPERKRIIHSAFRAHKRSEYALSIPVFLMQIDGICFDKLGMLLFQRDRSKPSRPKIAVHIDSLNIPKWELALLESMRVDLPLNSRVDSLQPMDKHFNRHAILHGILCDYDNEVNSLKSISLLDHVIENIPRMIDRV